MNKGRVVVVICTHNGRKRDVIENIKTINKSTYKNIDIVVVCNGITDGTDKLLKEKFPKVKLLFNKKNVGAALGRNKGMRYAVKHGQYTLTLDSDILVDRKAIENLVNSINDNPRLGASTPKVIFNENRKLIQYADVWIGLYTGINYNNAGLDDGRFDQPKITQCAGGNILIKNEVIKKIGYFDPIYFISYEDADYSLRINEVGYQIMYVPTARIYHKIPMINKDESTKRWLSRSYLTARNKIIFMKKHSKNFLIFSFFYPIYIFFYLYQSLKYKNPQAIPGYLRGIIDGIAYNPNSHHQKIIFN